jgi:lysophospholipase L1-like esterase
MQSALRLAAAAALGGLAAASFSLAGAHKAAQPEAAGGRSATGRARSAARGGAPAGGAEVFIPASSPNVWHVGRSAINADGSRSFDWEGTQMSVNVQGASYVKVLVNATGGAIGRIVVEAGGLEVSSFFVGGGNHATDYLDGVFFAAYDLSGTVNIRVISILEPSFGSAGPDAYLTFVGFLTDGAAAPPSAPRARRIELVGDSISAGYGSRGSVGLAKSFGCPVNDLTSGNYYTYNWAIAEHFEADIIPVAWSGKGMYVNCCDNGETMPSYYLQTRGGTPYARDWDFSRYTPDMMIINLGTNDFGHDSGPAWEAAFSATYVQFVLNATAAIYKRPSMPVFVAQGPMNNSPNLHDALHVAIAAINAAGGNATYLDLRGPPNDGCGGHPGVAGHSGMAALAIPAIGAFMGWA